MRIGFIKASTSMMTNANYAIKLMEKLNAKFLEIFCPIFLWFLISNLSVPLIEILWDFLVWIL